MSELAAQGVALGAGALLLSAVLLVWWHSPGSVARLLALQGAALGVLVLTLGVAEHDLELVLVAALVTGVKAVLVPWAVAATGRRAPEVAAPGLAPGAALVWTAVLTTVAFVAARPVVAASGSEWAPAVPVGLSLVLIGFLVMMDRRDALAQLAGFVVVDNGIATVAFLTTGGVPLVVELGASLDVVLVVLILRTLVHRIQEAFGSTDTAELQELAD